MEQFNKFLYTLCTISIVGIAAMTLVAIWGEMESIMLLKTIGTGVVLLIACLIVLGINMEIAKAKNKAADEEDKQDEQAEG